MSHIFSWIQICPQPKQTRWERVSLIRITVSTPSSYPYTVSQTSIFLDTTLQAVKSRLETEPASWVDTEISQVLHEETEKVSLKTRIFMTVLRHALTGMKVRHRDFSVSISNWHSSEWAEYLGNNEGPRSRTDSQQTTVIPIGKTKFLYFTVWVYCLIRRRNLTDCLHSVDPRLPWFGVGT